MIGKIMKTTVTIISKKEHLCIPALRGHMNIYSNKLDISYEELRIMYTEWGQLLPLYYLATDSIYPIISIDLQYDLFSIQINILAWLRSCFKERFVLAITHTHTHTHIQIHVHTQAWRLKVMVFFAIFQPYYVIYGGQFPNLEEQIVPGSEPATFR